MNFWPTTSLLARGSLRQLIAWPVGLFIICVATALAIADFYSEPAQRAAYSASMDAAPFATAISGSGTGLESLGGIVANEYGILLLNGVAIGAILLGIGLTRREEDLGRTELVTSFPVGRLTPLLGAAATVLASFALTSALVFGSFVVVDVPLLSQEDGSTGGPWLYALSVLAYAAFFLALGLVCAEACGDARTATIAGLGAYFLAYFVRIAVNATGSGAWWTTPLGWFDRVEPFAAVRFGPLALTFGAAAVLFAVALAVRSRRDIGGGVVHLRRTGEGSSALLGSPVGLVARLCAGTVLGWLVLAVAFGGLFGLMLDQWVEVMELNLESMAAFGFEANVDSISNLLGMLAAIFGAAAGVGIAGQLAKEEASTRLALLLSRPISRTRVWLGWVIVALTVAALIAVTTIGIYVLTGAWTLGAEFDAAHTAGALAWFIVPALTLTAVALVAVSINHHGTVVGWSVFAIAAVIALMGEAMNLPQQMLDAAPINSLGTVPVEDVTLAAAIIQAVVVAASMPVQLWVFNRREVVGS